nr:hypothetical protein [Kibdelosporangium sp. MJ126-NF4]
MTAILVRQEKDLPDISLSATGTIIKQRHTTSPDGSLKVTGLLLAYE